MAGRTEGRDTALMKWHKLTLYRIARRDERTAYFCRGKESLKLYSHSPKKGL